MRMLVAFLIIAISTPVLADVKSTDASQEAVRQFVMRHGAAMEKGDLVTLDSMYSADADVLIIEGGGVDRGWLHYRDHHLRPELKEMKNFTYRYDAVRAEVAGDLAWSTFDYALHGVIKGKPLDVVGKGTLILRRTAAGWKIVHSHTSGKPKRK
jgi:ketosteroid isomerase-like protein